MISVVVITFNRSGSLANCLTSLLKQSEKPHEIIVVDDGSTDDTKRVVKSFKDVRYVHQKHSGIAAARNLGIESVKGDIIAFTDDDCVADKDWLRNLSTAFRRYPSVAAVGGAVENGIDDDIHWAYHMLNFSKWIKRGRPRLIRDVPTANAAYRIDKVRGITFKKDGYPRCEDLFFSLDIRKAGGKVLFYPDALVYHRPKMDKRRFVSLQRIHGVGYMKRAYKADGIKGWIIRRCPWLGFSMLGILYYAKDCLRYGVYRQRFIRNLPLIIYGEYERVKGMTK